MAKVVESSNVGVLRIGRKAIKKILPHRGRALMLDSIIIDNGNPAKMIGRKKIGADNLFLDGHFPGEPVFPGYVQDELACLVAACLVLHFIPGIVGKPMVVKKSVKYVNIVRPGDDLVIEVELKKNRNNKMFIFSAMIKNQNDQTVASYEEIVGAAVK